MALISFIYKGLSPSKSVPIYRLFKLNHKITTIWIPSKLPRRYYAIEDRIVFPETEASKLEKKAKEEAEEKVRIKEEQKRVAKKLKSDIKYRMARPEIHMAGPEDLFPKYKAPLQPTNPRGLNLGLLGPANAGKSTLTNRLCRSKVTSVSTKAQTTRETMLGIFTHEDTQVTIFDTPGLLSKVDRRSLGKALPARTWAAMDLCDVALVVIDCVKTIDSTVTAMLERLTTYSKHRKENDGKDSFHCILFLNKYDKYLDDAFRVSTVYPAVDRFKKHFPALEETFDHVLVGSALTGSGFDRLVETILSYGIPRDWQYDKDTKTDLSNIELATEIIREKIFNYINQEIPYTISQENAGWTKDPHRGVLRIDQNLFLKKTSHMRVIDSKLPLIRDSAAKELKAALGHIIDLRLHAYVRKHQNEPSMRQDDGDDEMQFGL